MMKQKILLVEDETDVMLANKEYLEVKGFEIFCADSLCEAEDFVNRENMDMILLDINLPDGSGLDFAKKLRRMSSVPIIFLTCRTEKEDIIQGLNLSHGDYITKPYDLDILHARILANLSRMYLTIANIKLDRKLQRAYLDDIDIPLTRKEFTLLWHFFQHPNESMSTDDIFKAVWGTDSFGNTGTLRVAISELRKKLPLDGTIGIWLETAPLKGYCLRVKNKR